jgi:hypothetical protein
VRQSSNGGVSFRSVRTPAASGAVRALASGGGRRLLAAPRTLARSTDGGASRRPLPRPRGVTVADVAAPGARTLFVLGETGGCGARATSAGGGRRSTAWAPIEPAAIAFSDPYHGSAVPAMKREGWEGLILRTSDGGRTWRPHTNRWITSALATRRADYALYAEGEQELFFTTTGGDARTRTPLAVSARRRGQEVRITDRATPTRGRENVLLSLRTGGTWKLLTALADTHGRFVKTPRLVATTQVVAQWRGHDDRAGAPHRCSRCDSARGEPDRQPCEVASRPVRCPPRPR